MIIDKERAPAMPRSWVRRSAQRLLSSRRPKLTLISITSPDRFQMFLDEEEG